MTKRLPILLGEKTKTIQVGDWIADDIYYKSIGKERNTWLKERILEANGITLSPNFGIPSDTGYKDTHKEVLPYLGPSFNRYFTRLNCEYWIDEYHPLIDKACFYCRDRYVWFSTAQIVRFWHCRDVAVEVFNDGLYHLLPIIVYFGASPQRLKQRLGNAIWKYIATNSLTANKTIVYRFLKHDSERRESVPPWPWHRIEPICDAEIERYRLSLDTYSQVRVSLIKNSDYFDRFLDVFDSEEMENLVWFNQYCRVTNLDDIRHALHLRNDTKMMANENAKPFNPKWSRVRVNREHDRLAKSYYTHQRERWSLVPFQWLESINARMNVGDVTVAVLLSPADIAKEGYCQRHCVASYMPFVEQQQSVICSLRSTSERTTASYDIFHPTSLQLGQHYGTCNSPHISASHREAATVTERYLKQWLVASHGATDATVTLKDCA